MHFTAITFSRLMIDLKSLGGIRSTYFQELRGSVTIYLGGENYKSGHENKYNRLGVQVTKARNLQPGLRVPNHQVLQV